MHAASQERLAAPWNIPLPATIKILQRHSALTLPGATVWSPARNAKLAEVSTSRHAGATLQESFELALMTF